MNNQPQNQPMQAPQNYAAPAHQQPQQPQRSRRWLPWTILVIVIIIVLGIIALVFRSKLFPSSAVTADKLSGYQAVFLSNGQVYFGKISETNSDYVQLADIFYLQVNTPAGSTDTTSAATAVNSASSASTQLSLVKLGNELHGPADQMFINRDQILFYENLKADGQVAEAIVKYQQSGGTAGAADSTPAQGTTQAPSTTTGTSGSTTTVPTTGTTGTSSSTSNAPLIPAK
jgi:hypothetical protein